MHLHANPRDTWMFTGKDTLEEQWSMLYASTDRIAASLAAFSWTLTPSLQIRHDWLLSLQRAFYSLIMTLNCTLIGYHPQQVFLLVNYIDIIMCINYTIEIMYL
uniref:AlNc14C93G5767 protein n=1 Tax=Albugo laibachii Nc14 TaxID=890382 RepID=F0WGP0_9STRA|nr:AlNc14C93G5767 [Albugo laibachii Nc14]|eukprot:CCA20404.1 AlNc14C93G5767 [Albugo laibachii Nc14]